MTDKLRMDAYYYGFEETGVRAIDEVLSAVATAGKRYHYTANWNEDDLGPSPVDVIQEAANRAADRLRAAEAVCEAEAAHRDLCDRGQWGDVPKSVLRKQEALDEWKAVRDG